MSYFEYLELRLIGSRGCKNIGTSQEMFWNTVQLFTLNNGVSKMQNLAGGIETIEEHLNRQLKKYSQQDWQLVKVARSEAPLENGNLKKTIQCVLKRGIKLESSKRFDELSKNLTKIYPNSTVARSQN